MSDSAIFVGAVAVGPRVLTFWDALTELFRAQNVAIEFALFSSYERQLESLLAGHLDVAYASPLSHARAKRRTEGRTIAIGAADIDRGVCAKIVVRRDAGIGSFTDLHGKIVAVACKDAAHARILPTYYLAQAGVDLAKLQLLPFDLHVGKHGDNPQAELSVLEALHDGRAQAGIIGSRIWTAENAAGRVDPHRVEVLWTTPTFDTRVLHALPQTPQHKIETLQRVLFAMSYKNPAHRKVLDIEGMRQWVAVREEGYAALMAALDMGLVPPDPSTSRAPLR